MATEKEKAQAERVAQNAENQRRQDEFGLGVAQAQRDFALAGEGDRDLGDETRRIHAELIERDQRNATLNDSAVDDDALVSEDVVGEGKEEYVEEGPEDRAYDAVVEQSEGVDVELSEGAEAEVEASDAEAPESGDEVREDEDGEEGE